MVGDLLAVAGFKNGSSDQSLGFITFKMKYSSVCGRHKILNYIHTPSLSHNHAVNTSGDIPIKYAQTD